MREKRNRCVVLGAMLALASCAPAVRQAPTYGMAASSIAVTVTNDNWLDVVVYAVRGSMRVRIGEVTGNSSSQLRIPASVVVANEVRLLVDPIGSTETYLSDPINVDTDQRVQLTVAPAVQMSSYAVRMR